MTRISDSKSWLEIGVKFGVPALIACYLVYILAGGVRDDVLSIKNEIHSHVKSTEKADEAQINIMNRMLLISQQQCISQARTARRNEQECWK